MNESPSPLLEWSDSFALGHEAIDDDHSELFARVNALAASISRKEAWPQTAQHAEQLIEFARDHFGREEALMRETRYAGLTPHAEQHIELLSQIEMLRDRLAADHYLARPQRFLDFLADWFALHISRSDRALVAFLATQPRDA